MKRTIKLILVPFVLLATLFLVTACGNKTNGYDMNNKDGYTVSVKYDANGGVFTGTSAVMVDSFKIDEMKKDSSGMVQLKLLKPTDSSRGDWNPSNGKKMLAGWYKERIESTDSNGNVVYTYSGEFNFDTDVVTVDPSKVYSSSEPVLTLYAVWVDPFSVNFVDIDTDESIGTYEFNPKGTSVNLKVPTWNTTTGNIDMNRFPVVDGKTFVAAYYDKEGTQLVEDVIIHEGTTNSAGEAVNPVKTVYVKYMEGKWFHVYNAEQLFKNAALDGNYVLHADLDFTDEIWPSTFMHGEFKGSIQSVEGECFTIKNVAINQTNNNKNLTGLFGGLSATAKISNVKFENATLTITAGARNPGAFFGLLAGSIADGATLENITITNGKIIINTDKYYFKNTDVSIGLVCGMGSYGDIDYSDITCEAIGKEADRISVDGDAVIVSEE